MESTCRRAFHVMLGGLQRMSEGTFAGTRGNDKVAPILAISEVAIEPPTDPKAVVGWQ